MTKKKDAGRFGFMRGDGDVVVTLNDRLVRMQQRVTAHSTDGRLVAHLELAPAGTYVLTGLEFKGSVDEPVDARELRVRLQDLVAEIAASVSSPLVEVADGTWAFVGGLRTPEARQVSRRAPKRTLTPEFLREQVAPVVAACEHDGIPIGRGLAQHFTISESTARNWLMRLRELEGQS